MLKRIAYKFYKFIFRSYFTIKFFLVINILTKDDEIYIFDIDNTIAHTWPSFLVGYSNEKERLGSLAVFINMREYILRLRLMGKKVFFMSARSYRTYNITYQWLKSVDLIDSKRSLFLVSNPREKIYLLKLAKKKVYFYDDMTYNHEKGEVRFYIDEIEKLVKLPHVKYYGIEEIEKIIGGI